MGRLRFLAVLLVLLHTLMSCGDDNPVGTEDREVREVTWWSTNRATAFGIDMDQLPVFQELQERTGSRITFVHPSPSQYSLRFRMMLSSGDLPDIISHDFVNDYPGGVLGAIEDHIVMPLDRDLLQHAPYLRAFLRDHPEAAEEIALPQGRYSCFPSFNADKGTSTYMGPFIRADLLRKHGLEAPETLAEWETVLATFAADPEIDIPLGFYGGNIRETRFLISTFGTDWSFIVREEHLAYGPAEPEFVDFIDTFTRWYRDGWMDPGVLFNSRRAYSRSIARNTVGIYVDYVSTILDYEHMVKEQNQNAEIVPISYPRRDETSPIPPGHDAGRFIPFAAAYVTTAADDPVAVVRMLDYAWSPEGSRLFNFGIEGSSYDIVEGQPVLREEIFTSEVARNHRFYLVAGPYAKDPQAFLQSLRLPSQREAVILWSEGLTDRTRRPTISNTSRLTVGRFMELKNTLDTYAFETALDIVSGKAGDDAATNLRKELLRLGLTEALELAATVWVP